MTHAASGVLSDHLASLFGAGTCAGLTDGELLERFRTSRDESGERAFEALVTRHGPMVLGICRHFIEDPTDAHDAFQAVFLVLARRAGTIRKGESLGSWLYGVTVRLAARARATAIRRRIRERRVLATASAAALAGRSPDASAVNAAERDDGAAVVHEEVARLPERYRTPIVLCYFEGLTHDEAAARLSWPVGTVRSRLARARDQLRGRLTRRGVVAPSTIGPLAAWLIAGQSPATASAAIRAAAAASPLPVHVPASLARAAVQVAAGQPAAAGSFSVASLSLADGVLATMMLKKLAIIAGVIVTLGIGSGTGAFLIRSSRAQNPPPAAPAKPVAGAAAPQPVSPATLSPNVYPAKPVAGAAAPQQSGIDRLLAELVQAARERLDAEKVLYQSARTTNDRYLAAAAELARVELLAAKTDAERRAIRQRQVDLAKQIEDFAQQVKQFGRGTAADLAESRQRRIQAEYDMITGEKDDAEKAALLRRIAELERRVDQLEKERAGRK
jgi:RNA polymerase sigma factor (sigma-70 family)